MSTNIRTLIIEAVTAFVLVFLAVGAGVLAVAAKVGIRGSLVVGTTTLAIAMAIALLVLGGLVARGPLATCHITPSVTLALLRRGQISTERAVDAWVGQAIGAIGAGVALVFVVPWATSTSTRSPAVTVTDILLGGLLSVVLLAIPTVGSLIVGRPATLDDRALGDVLMPPVSVAVVPPPPEPPPVVAGAVPVEESAQELEAAEALQSVRDLDVPEVAQPPSAAPSTAPAPEPALALAESAHAEASSGPATPLRRTPTLTISNARISAPRSARPVTRVRAPFPPGPSTSAYPVRRLPVEPGSPDGPAPDPAPGEEAPKVARAGKPAKADKAKHPEKKGKGKNRSSTVVVQVKVERKSKSKKEKKGKKAKRS